MMNKVDMDVQDHLGSIALKRYLGRNLMIGLSISVFVHLVGGPSLYYAWLSLFKRPIEEMTHERIVSLQLSPKIVPLTPKPKPSAPAPSSRGLRGSKGGGTPGQIAKPSVSMRMQPVSMMDLQIADDQAINREPIPKNTTPDFPGMLYRPVADAAIDHDIDVNQPGYNGGALPGPKTYGGPEVANPSAIATRGVPGGPPGDAIKGRYGDELGTIGTGRGGSGPPPGSGIGGGGAGSGSASYGIGRGTGPEGIGRGAEGDYSSSVGGGGTGSTGVVDGQPPISKAELAGLMQWLKGQDVTFSPVLQAYLGTRESDLCGITSYGGWNIFVQFSEIEHQLKIFLTQGSNGILLADSDFKLRSQYFAAGNVARTDNAISAIEAVREKPSPQRTEEFYHVFGNWMAAQGISLRERANR